MYTQQRKYIYVVHIFTSLVHTLHLHLSIAPAILEASHLGIIFQYCRFAISVKYSKSDKEKKKNISSILVPCGLA